MKYIKPKDIIALTIIISFMLLKYKGYNGGLDSILAIILGYYFAKRTERKDNGM